MAYNGTNAPVTCGCPAEAASADGSGFDKVYGIDIYADRSLVCRAARHAGAIGEAGGNVTVIPMPGQQAYPGNRRNGIVSNDDSANRGSFRFALPAAASAPTAAPMVAQNAPQPSPAPTAAFSGALCPDDFMAYNGTNAPVTCGCPGEAASADGSGFDKVYGIDIYADRSLVCRAARHAGAIGEAGGNVTVIPMPGQQAYPGNRRNGIVSNNDSANRGSFRFAPPARPVTGSAGPVQQPIAASLRERGQVELYVRFRTASADLDPETVPILDELLVAIKADLTINLALVGHTDNVGGRDYNRGLSYQRAEAVRFWLAGHGISPARMVVEGRGFDEPLADNENEQGRAINRRVQAKRM